MDTIRTYLVEVILKKVVTSAVISGVASAIAFFVAHAEFMEKLGLTYYPSFNGQFIGPMPTGQVFLLEVDTFKAWAVVAGPMAGMALVVWVWHHMRATATGAPQSGDVRKSVEMPMVGGNRQGDPQ